jgi:hypothetical protein
MNLDQLKLCFAAMATVVTIIKEVNGGDVAHFLDLVAKSSLVLGT